MNCPECGTENLNGAKFCSCCGKPIDVQRPIDSSRKNTAQGLGWHKFMIYFSLFAGAALNLRSGIQAISGLQYGDLAEAVYMVFGGLKALDIVYGLLLMCISGLCIYTRFQLARFKRGAPKLIAILYGCTVIIPIVYLGLFDAITGIKMMDESVVSGIIGSLTMATINIIYYNKRKDLFIN